MFTPSELKQQQLLRDLADIAAANRKYAKAVQALIDKGASRSDAQAVVDAQELIKAK